MAACRARYTLRMLAVESLHFGLRVAGGAVLVSFVVIACGGQTDNSSTALDTGGNTSVSSSGGTSSVAGSDALSAGGTFDVPWKGDAGTRGDSGAACSMPAADMDDTCVTDSDCTEVPGGNPCFGTCACLIGMNVRVAEKYVNDYIDLLGSAGSTVGCACPCLTAACCRQGHCQNSCGLCN